MFKISDPTHSDKVYYIEDQSDDVDGVIDPHKCFANEDLAVEYAIKEMGLSVLDFSIMEWRVE